MTDNQLPSNKHSRPETSSSTNLTVALAATPTTSMPTISFQEFKSNASVTPKRCTSITTTIEREPKESIERRSDLHKLKSKDSKLKPWKSKERHRRSLLRSRLMPRLPLLLMLPLHKLLRLLKMLLSPKLRPRELLLRRLPLLLKLKLMLRLIRKKLKPLLLLRLLLKLKQLTLLLPKKLLKHPLLKRWILSSSLQSKKLMLRPKE